MYRMAFDLVTKAYACTTGLQEDGELCEQKNGKFEDCWFQKCRKLEMMKVHSLLLRRFKFLDLKGGSGVEGC